MLLLTSTSDKVRLTTSAAAAVDVHASYADNASGTITFGRTNTAQITTATTTDVVASPGASTSRTVQLLTVRNAHASVACDVTVIHTDGTNAETLYKATLAAGKGLLYSESAGWQRFNAAGLPVAPGNAGAADVQVFSGSGGTWTKAAAIPPVAFLHIRQWHQ